MRPEPYATPEDLQRPPTFRHLERAKRARKELVSSDSGVSHVDYELQDRVRRRMLRRDVHWLYEV